MTTAAASFEHLLTESPVHRVRAEPGGFTLSAISEAQRDVENFRPIARQALACAGADCEITPHPSDYGIDEVFIRPTTATGGQR